MTNYICINGKKAELTEEQMKALGIELPKASPFDRVAKDKQFYYIGSNGVVGITRECNNGFDDKCFNTANYCTDLDMMRQRALHETLNRLLWRYSMEHKADEISFSGTGRKVRYTIGFWEPDDTWRTDGPGFHVSPCARGYNLCPYFESKKIAEAAIKEIIEPFMEAHPEFKW